MAVYFFDFREGGAFVVDEEGIDLRDVEAAQAEAARSLSGIAWDAMRSAGAQAQEMTIEVRDVCGPVMDVKFAFAPTNANLTAVSPVHTRRAPQSSFPELAPQRISSRPKRYPIEIAQPQLARLARHVGLSPLHRLRRRRLRENRSSRHPGVGALAEQAVARTSLDK